MKYRPPFVVGGNPSPSAPYVDRNTPGATSGSVPPAAAIEHPQREIGHVIDFFLGNGTEFSAQDPDDLQQLRKALQAALSGYLRIPMGVTKLYVRTDGNDDNDGSANTAAKAFLTPQAAINYAARNFYTGSQAIEIVLGVAGTYPGFSVASGNFLVSGATASPSSYIVSGSPGSSVLVAVNSASLRLKNMRVSRGDNGNHVMSAQGGGTLTVENIESQITVTSSYSHIASGTGGSVSIAGPVTALSSAGSVLSCTAGSMAIFDAITVQGGAVFTNSTVNASVGGTIDNSPGASWIVAGGGNPSAQRFNVSTNGVINTNGGGVNFFPGTASGVASTGGQYV